MTRLSTALLALTLTGCGEMSPMQWVGVAILSSFVVVVIATMVAVAVRDWRRGDKEAPIAVGLLFLLVIGILLINLGCTAREADFKGLRIVDVVGGHRYEIQDSDIYGPTEWPIVPTSAVKIEAHGFDRDLLFVTGFVGAPDSSGHIDHIRAQRWWGDRTGMVYGNLPCALVRFRADTLWLSTDAYSDSGPPIHTLRIMGRYVER
jgi:hypothetical protein